MVIRPWMASLHRCGRLPEWRDDAGLGLTAESIIHASGMVGAQSGHERSGLAMHAVDNALNQARNAHDNRGRNICGPVQHVRR